MLAASLAISVSFFVGAGFFAIKKRSNRFGLAMAIVLGICGILSLILNPIPNIMLGVSIDEARLVSIRKDTLGQPDSVLFRALGKPAATWTNEYGTFFSWKGTSPFWSMYPQDTMALASNGVITAVWKDD